MKPRFWMVALAYATLWILFVTFALELLVGPSGHS